jgi:hypothetical protein
MTNLLVKNSGEYINLFTNFKGASGIIIFLYLFINLTRPILLYNKAKCFPMHDLAPPPNPPITKGGMLALFSHLSGKNSDGFL